MDILIVEMRNERKMSLRQLEMLTGISKSTLNDIENGRSIPNIMQLEKMAKSLKCKISDLIKSEYL